MRDSILMYRSVCEALKALPPEQFKAAAIAIWDYGMDDKEVQDGADPVAVAILKMAKPLIDRNNTRYQIGRTGGRPKKEKTQGQPEQEPQPKPKKEYPYKEIIEYLNSKAGTSFRPSSRDSQSHIRARMDEGFTLDDFKKVINGRCTAWKNDPRMKEYLRPSTLFGTKFESYLNAGTAARTGFNAISQREYDYEQLERQLLAEGDQV